MHLPSKFGEFPTYPGFGTRTAGGRRFVATHCGGRRCHSGEACDTQMGIETKWAAKNLMVKTMVSCRFFPINPYESQSVVDHSRKFPTMWGPPVMFVGL